MNDDRRAQLWDFVYGLLDDADARILRQQITSDRELARDYARVKLQSELVASAARATAEAGCWPDWKTGAASVTLAEKHSRSNSARLASNIVTLLASSLAAMLLLYVGYAYLRADSPLLTREATVVAQAADAYPRMLVTGPTTLVRSLRRTVNSLDSEAPIEQSQPQEPTQGATLRGEESPAFAEYEVLFQRLDSQPIAMPVQVSLFDQDNHSLWQKHFTSATDGTCRFAVPTPAGGASVVQLHIAAEPALAASLAREFEIATNSELTTWLTVVDRELNSPESQEIFPISAGVALYREVIDSRSSLQQDFGEQSPATLGIPHVRWGLLNPAILEQQTHQFASNHAYDAEPWKFAPLETESLEKHNEALNRLAPSLNSIAAATNAPPTSDLSQLGEAGAGIEQPSRSLGRSFRGAESATSNDSRSLTESPRLVVESVVQQQQVVSSRFVAVTGTTTVDQQVRAKATNRNDSNRLTGESSRYDFTSAPPELLQREEPAKTGDDHNLHANTQFNRVEYRADQEIIASVAIVDESSRPQPAMLGVWVEQLAPETIEPETVEPIDRFTDQSKLVIGEAVHGLTLKEAPSTFAASLPLGDVERLEQVSRGRPTAGVPLPLVFDNGLGQQQHIADYLSMWRAKQFQQRINVRRILLMGSGIGLLLMAAAACGDWLPKRRVWLPISLALGCCLLLGMGTPTTPPATDQTALALAQPPLTNYGLCEQPPVATLGQIASHSLELGVNSFDAYADVAPDANGYYFRAPSNGTAVLSLPQQQDRGERFFKATAAAKHDGGAPHDIPHVWQWAELAAANGPTTKKVALLAQTESDSLDLNYSKHLPEQKRLFGALPRSLGEEALAERPMQASPAGRRIVCWHPGIVTNSKGRAQLRFTLPNSVASFRLVVEAHGSDRHGATAAMIPTTCTLNP